MISRLFRTKPRLDSKEPGDRRVAIEALSEAEAEKVQAELGRLAREDADPGVRRSAITRVQDEATLKALLGEAEQADRAVARILELNEHGRCQALAELPEVLAAQLPSASDPGALATRLIELGGQTLLIDALLGTGREQRESLLELPQLSRFDTLQELERRSRDRDKKTNRFARARLDEIRQQASAAGELAAEVAERLTSLEKPADDSELERERRIVLLDRVEHSLAELTDLNAALHAAGAQAPATAALAERYRQLRDQNEQARATASQAPPALPVSATPGAATAAEPATTTAGNDAFESLARQFQALDEALTSNPDFQALAAQRQTLTEQWLAHADHAPPSDAQHRIFETVSHRFQVLAEAYERLTRASFASVDPDSIPDALSADTDPGAWRSAEAAARAAASLKKTLNHISWPDWAATPELLTRQQTLAERAQHRLDAWRRLVEAGIDELGQALKTLDSLIDAGELKSARAEAGRIRKRLKPMPERSAGDLNRHLARASARLGELSDWQTYATTPKREALLSAMTEIAESPLPAADQASRIKALRADWNALGPVGRADDHKLLDAFNEMAEKAFEPCRSHFAEQAEVRAANLAAREAICDSLSEYLAATDWASTDYKAAERIMRTARDEWRAHHPVDRSAGKALEARFEALQADLHQHIKAEWDRNLEAKRQIVQEAQALAASEQPVPEQVEGAKRLQQRWKAIGTTPRRPDQTLWRDFRAACDAIFDNRDTAKRSEDAEIQSNRQTAEQLLADFRARLDDASNPIDAADLRAFQTQYDELPSLPERLARALERERDGLIRVAQQQLRAQRAEAARVRLENLKTQDAEVAALEQQQMAGTAVQFTPPDPVFANRCQADAAPLSVEDLTRIVIEAEIAAGLESEETALRMSLQVEMMNAGRGREALQVTPEELLQRWCELGPKNEQADSLRDRIFKAIDKLLEQ